MIDAPWPVIGLVVWAAVLALDLAYTLVTSRRRRGSEWLGKRKTTPRELRRYAKEAGWSEDFARYDDRQLADWLNRGGWDIAAGKFQGGVEKPTEADKRNYLTVTTRFM